ncbi:glycosyltransferase family 2 protein [Paraglaciecola sp.]|uniref:glycosyltransferase family 2 protein n=1 Tax=Paraglaciecola sp. TaxID=1920173 RepID=UPI00273E6E36|nr:glycosyltransferase family 2 protein [Paraglaciecola sp.]MDP5032262.1 glycosyltransferase [Paraglaciecola sp.]
MSNSTPLISVIVPIYNREKFLPQLFNTIFAQDYDNYEVIIVDDGSTDESAKWIENNKHTFRKEITLLQQTNAGHYAARNNGLDHAKGELIAFQDSDDEWPPYHLSQFAALFEQNPDVDWIFGRLHRIDHETRETVEESNFVTKEGVPHPFLLLNSENREGGLNVINDKRIGEVAVLNRVPGSTQSAIMRKKIYSSLRFDPSYRTAYDQFFAVRVVLAGFKFGFVNEIHQIYHIHDAHISMVAGGDADKKEKSARTHIRGYASLLPHTHSDSERKAVNKRLSQEWAWSLSTALREKKLHKEEFKAMCNAIKLYPNDPLYWKTAFAALARSITG